MKTSILPRNVGARLRANRLGTAARVLALATVALAAAGCWETPASRMQSTRDQRLEQNQRDSNGASNDESHSTSSTSGNGRGGGHHPEKH